MRTIRRLTAPESAAFVHSFCAVVALCPFLSSLFDSLVRVNVGVAYSLIIQSLMLKYGRINTNSVVR